jgi:dienelactone hydrolase
VRILRGAICFLFSYSICLAEPEWLPVEKFFARPTFSELDLSPDGKYMGAVYWSSNHCYLHITDLDTGKRRLIQGEDIWSFKWITSQRVVYYTGGRSFGGIVAINIDGTEKATLIPPWAKQSGLRVGYAKMADLLDVMPQSTNDLLVERAEVHLRLPRDARWDVGRINSRTGKFVLEEKNPGNVLRWLADSDGIIRAAVARDKDEIKLLYRGSKAESWRTVAASRLEINDLVPLKVSADGKHLKVAAHNGHNMLGLYDFDPQSQQLGDCLWQNDQSDVGRALWSDNTELLGVLTEREKLQVKPLSPMLAKWQRDMDEVLPNCVNFPIRWSRDANKVLYFSMSDRDPGSYYLVNTTNREFGQFARRFYSIKPEQLAPMRPIEYKSRDGLTIHGYLTLPLQTPGTNLAMVVVPHGGPWVRDSWEFDPMIQFLADRGYAVLQMNFRGSVGYGLEFERAGYKEWGGKMQDDITDGVRWAISERIANKDRIAIFGASYGGYAALMGLITTPELYKCGISYAGITDVNAWVRGMRFKGQSGADVEAIWRERIGDYRSDQKHLDAISPVRLVEKIQVPILLAYGGLDPKVKLEEGLDLANALKKKHKKYELIVEPFEGHGFHSLPAQTNLFNRVELFLKANL